jgi:glycosyltransferase involved in cell wall biosynthesis
MDTELFTWTIPAKLQSYMACGMPIIAAAKGETERIVHEAECGVCVGIGDADELAGAISKILESCMGIGDTKEGYKKKLGGNSRKYFEENFTKKKLMDEFEIYLTK